MKHILVGIDFSESADRALAYAEEIALVFSSKINLVYIHPPSNGNAEEEKIDLQRYSKACARLAELAASVGDRGITTMVTTYRGEVVPTLKRIIADGDCDLVVMGCQGENYLPNNPWGSTTTYLMEDTRIPILAVPSYAPVKYPRRFLLATDKECPTRLRQLHPLLQLLEAPRTKLLLFHFQEATEQATPDREYARLLQGIEHQFYYQADDHQPIGNAVVGFTNLTASDILVVTHRSDHWLGDKAPDSVARRVTWTASVPVLILQDSF
jgi:nucleotide-binding universal stress UspA family protein